MLKVLPIALRPSQEEAIDIARIKSASTRTPDLMGPIYGRDQSLTLIKSSHFISQMHE